VQIERALSTAMAYGAREDAGGWKKEGSKDSVGRAHVHAGV
jgi:hypothetical protein